MKDEVRSVGKVKWTVHELTDTGWRRFVFAHWWELKADAEKQMDELAARFPKKFFRLEDDSYEG